MKKKILITRPIDKSQDFAQALEREGYDVLIEPMLELRDMDFIVPPLSRYDGIIITSTTAFQFIGHLEIDKKKPLYVVGPASAQAAHDFGFIDVTSADGSAADIEELLPEGKRFLRVRGEDTPYLFGDNVDSLVVYKAEQVEDFSAMGIAALKTKQISVVTFFSERTAENFVRLVRKHRLSVELESINSLSISPKVLECVQTCVWAGTYVADKPNGQAMIEALARIDSYE